MKKLMVAFAVAAMAVAAQAVSVNWKVETGIQITGDFDEGDGDWASAGWAAYLFDNSVVSRDAMITALSADNSLDQFLAFCDTETGVKYADLQPTLADGAVAGSANLAVDAGNKVNAYLVLIDAAAPAENQYAFVSQLYSETSKDPVPTALTLTDDGEYGDMNALDYSDKSNWYQLQTAAPIPEPTSGLLLLLGVAGLALRRRRA